jgi:hypothetical protein
MRLEKLLGSSLDLDECIVLISILSTYTIKWGDEFVINDWDAQEDYKVLGFTGAAFIAACFCTETRMDGRMLKTEYMHRIGPPYAALHASLIKRILADPHIEIEGVLREETRK